MDKVQYEGIKARVANRTSTQEDAAAMVAWSDELNARIDDLNVWIDTLVDDSAGDGLGVDPNEHIDPPADVEPLVAVTPGPPHNPDHDEYPEDFDPTM